MEDTDFKAAKSMRISYSINTNKNKFAQARLLFDNGDIKKYPLSDYENIKKYINIDTLIYDDRIEQIKITWAELCRYYGAEETDIGKRYPHAFL